MVRNSPRSDFRSRQNIGESRQPFLFQLAADILKHPVRQGLRATFSLRATGMQRGFDIVQIHDGGVAYRGGLLPIRRTPEVFDDRDLVMLATGGRGDLAPKTGEPVHEWRDAPRQASRITRGPGQGVVRVRR